MRGTGGIHELIVKPLFSSLRCSFVFSYFISARRIFSEECSAVRVGDKIVKNQKRLSKKRIEEGEGGQVKEHASEFFQFFFVLV